MDKTKSPEERAELVLKAMNWTEKASLVRGRGSVLPYTGHTLAIDRLNIPQVNLEDNGNGFRTDDHQGTST